MKNNYFVYKHASPSNKVYIGITRNKLNCRFGYKGNGYLRKNKFGNFSQPLFAYAIMKYGWDNFIHEIVLEGVSKSEAIYAEKYLIKWYKLHKMSYNITDGGDGALGTHCSEENKRKLRESRKGIPKPKHVIEACAEAHKKPVEQYTLKGEYIATYLSVIDAAKALNLSNNGSNIASCCNHNYKYKAAYGFIWRYKGDKTPIIPIIKPKIGQYLNGESINTFSSIREATRAVGGKSHRGILMCCKREGYVAYGYQWKFIYE